MVIRLRKHHLIKEEMGLHRMGTE